MTDSAVALLVATLVVAAVDWYAVGTGHRPLEYVAKPATMLVLIAAAVALDPVDSTARTWFVAALVCSLAGDVFLMLPRDLFVAGLASFLVGHVAYIGGLWAAGTSTGWLLVGAAVIGVLLPSLGWRIVVGVRNTEPALIGPVAVYIVAISAMVVSAAGTGEILAFGGALSFYASDALIAWNRFVDERPWGRLAIIVTYHLAQVALVASIAA